MSIAGHEFADADVEQAIVHDSYVELVTTGVCCIHIEKDDAYAIAKHFGLIDAWVSVEERLPDEDVTVLCWCNDIVSGWVEALYLMDGIWRYSSDSSSFPCIVTHWKPLPQPPKGTTK